MLVIPPSTCPAFLGSLKLGTFSTLFTEHYGSGQFLVFSSMPPSNSFLLFYGTVFYPLSFGCLAVGFLFLAFFSFETNFAGFCTC